MVYTVSVVDVKEYIASGILESVVLGLASEQEKQEVSCLSHIYPEIREELKAVEQAFEKLAFEHAVAPAASVRESILSAIHNEAQIPATDQKQETKIVQMGRAIDSTKQPNPWKWMAAACVVLLIATSVLWFNSSSQTEKLSEKLAAMETEQQKSEQVLTAMQLEKDRLDAIQSVLSEESMKKVMMSGTKMAPESSVKVMWSDKGHKAVMVAESIMEAPKDMQYQLWAIADGKPVSLGLFDYDEVMNMTEPFDVMPENITAFAITMEKRGGSPVPTMENMVVIGEI